MVHPAAVVFGRDGAAAVVAVPLLRSAFLPVPPWHAVHPSAAARDVASLLCRGGGVRTGPGGGMHVLPRAPVTSIAQLPEPANNADADQSRTGSRNIIDCVSPTANAETNPPPFLLAAGGTLSRVATGVAATVTPVSPPGFNDVIRMWWGSWEKIRYVSLCFFPYHQSVDSLFFNSLRYIL